MRYLVLVFWLLASPAWGAIARNGSIAYDGCSSAPCTQIITGNVNSSGAQAVSVVTIKTATANDTTATISDSAGSSWNRLVNINNGNDYRVELWYSANLLGSNVVITVDLTNSRTASVVTDFYTGVAATGHTATNTGGSNTTATIDVATQDNNNWAVAGCGSGATTYSASVGNLRGQVESFDGVNAATTVLNDNTNGTPATVTNTVTLSDSSLWACVVLELRSVSTSSHRSSIPIIFQ